MYCYVTFLGLFLLRNVQGEMTVLEGGINDESINQTKENSTYQVLSFEYDKVADIYTIALWILIACLAKSCYFKLIIDFNFYVFLF